jgi:hypothetical protein
MSRLRMNVRTRHQKITGQHGCCCWCFSLFLLSNKIRWRQSATHLNRRDRLSTNFRFVKNRKTKQIKKKKNISFLGVLFCSWLKAQRGTMLLQTITSQHAAVSNGIHWHYFPARGTRLCFTRVKHTHTHTHTDSGHVVLQ